MRHPEMELQEQLPNLHQENTRISALLNQTQVPNSSMNTRNQELALQLQMSSSELSRLQTENSNLRTSVARKQSTESRDAENIQNVRQETTSLARDNLQPSAEVEGFTFRLQEAEIETVRAQSLSL